MKNETKARIAYYFAGVLAIAGMIAANSDKPKVTVWYIVGIMWSYLASIKYQGKEIRNLNQEIESKDSEIWKKNRKLRKGLNELREESEASNKKLREELSIKYREKQR